MFVESVGNLSKTSKMPCLSWSISAFDCKRGGVLNKMEKTVCSGCYARKNFYVIFPKVRQNHDKNLELCFGENWVKSFADFINKRKLKWFRWFDSGDLQNEIMLSKICHIAKLCNDCRFWLPTHERGIVYNYWRMMGYKKLNELYPNLTIRISHDYIDRDFDKVDKKLFHSMGVFTSTVKTKNYNCKAYSSKGNTTHQKCGDCRLCWTSKGDISYRRH